MVHRASAGGQTRALAPACDVVAEPRPVPSGGRGRDPYEAAELTLGQGWT